MTKLHNRILIDKELPYNTLLASLGMIKNQLNCDSNMLVANNTAITILNNLFNSGVSETKECQPKEWFDIQENCYGCVSFLSCFDDKKIYYYDKDCKVVYSLWKPSITECIKKAVRLSKKKYRNSQIKCGCNHYIGSSYKTFKELADLFVFYLTYNPTCEKLIEYLVVFDALCDLLKQRISIDRVIRKDALTLD